MTSRQQLTVVLERIERINLSMMKPQMMERERQNTVLKEIE